MRSGKKQKNQILFVLRAFQSRNYRLFFGGQGLSLVGTWMQQIAMSWLVYRMTGSALLLGLIGFAGQAPAILFTPIAGVFADRLNRHRLLIFLQVLSMFQAAALAYLTLTDHVTVLSLFVLSIVLGILSAFEIPTRQSFVVDMLDHKEDLINAIALNSFMFNSARLVGPSIAGLAIGLAGEGICFLFNAVSFLAVIIALLLMRIPRRNGVSPALDIWPGLKEGVRYALGFAPIRYVLLLVALISLAGMPYLVLMPVFAKDLLGGGPQTLGFLMGASGLGALLGALYLASRESIVGTNKRIIASSILFGICLIAFAFSRSFPLSLVLMFATGLGMITTLATANTALQTLAEEDKRGRVVGFYVLALAGTMPLGSLLAGIVAHRIGAPITLMLGGATCILAASFFYFKLPVIREQVQPVYRQLGLVEELP
ncbi:MAG TPA: MFS transporter, partial [Deltaproteobacteria bacterium]|nr:MFS transporter [Deltaproteobacteria bacterium]